LILWLTYAQIRVVCEIAQADAPHETCGLIGGVEINGVLRAVEIVATPNTALDPRHHYSVDGSALVQTMMDFEAKGLSLVGIYHSHPFGEPSPSQEDVRTAYYPDTPYLIVGVKPNHNPSLAAWNFHHGEVDRVELHIGDDPPAPPDVLSSAQKVAILMSALIAIAFMILLSLSLLPPAPEIPR
jgi:proteasome lid subunit RPN8/RPN11